MAQAARWRGRAPLDTYLGQLQGWPWHPSEHPGILINDHGQRIRQATLSCRLGGSRHEPASWGTDVSNFGAAGFCEAEVLVCANPLCMREKRVRIREST